MIAAEERDKGSIASFNKFVVEGDRLAEGQVDLIN